MFLWKHIDIDEDKIKDLQERYLKCLPDNAHFFQPVNIGITHFLGMEIQRAILIQVAPNAVGRIHTDWRPLEYGNQLALQIPLINCEQTVTSLWESDYTPPTQYTDNGQPYNYFDPSRCKKLSQFNLTQPTIFRTDLPHSVDNPTDNIRKAISIRFKDDPWHLVNT